jgi:hypothetical protein
MTTSLRDFVAHAAQRASAIFEERGRIRPMYHAVAGNGADLLFTAPPGDKNLSIMAARIVLSAMRATRVAFIDEAWMLDAPSGDIIDVDKVNREGVEAQPNRIEVLVISAEDEAEGMLMATRRIDRHGDRAVLGDLQMLAFDSVEGPMIGLLPRKGMLQ